MSVLSLHPDIAERVETARQINNSNPGLTFTEKDFLHHIFMMGLLEWEFRIQPKIKGKPYKAYKSKNT